MIIDSSILVAIIFRESEAERYVSAMSSAERLRLSVANLLEATIVIEGRGSAELGRELEELISDSGIELVPVTVEQVQAARRAWRRFGKGNHAARLNFGDCFAYALAETSGEPLLFKGEDFALTDVQRANV